MDRRIERAFMGLNDFSRRMKGIMDEIKENLPRDKREKLTIYHIRPDLEDFLLSIDHAHRMHECYVQFRDHCMESVFRDVLKKYDCLSDSFREKLVRKLCLEVTLLSESDKVDDSFFDFRNKLPGHFEKIEKTIKKVNTKEHVDKVVKDMLKNIKPSDD